VPVLSRANLKARDESKITLFANKGEAIVFWLSVAGLIFLAIISVFRYYSNKSLYMSESEKQTLLSKVDNLERTNQLYLSQLDSLKTVLHHNEMQIHTLSEELQKLKATWSKKSVVKKTTPIKKPTKKVRVDNRRNRRVLEEFRIKRP